MRRSETHSLVRHQCETVVGDLDLFAHVSFEWPSKLSRKASVVAY